MDQEDIHRTHQILSLMPLSASSYTQASDVTESSDYKAKIAIHRSARRRAILLALCGVLLFGCAIACKALVPDSPMKTWASILFVIFAAPLTLFGLDKIAIETMCLNGLGRGVENRQLVVNKILAGQPFALYLHDVASEQPVYRRAPGLPIMLFPNRSEEHLAKQLDGKLPVFAFINHWDAFQMPFNRIVAGDGQEWFNLFQLYCDAASLVIFDLDHIGKAVRDELNHVVANAHTHKTILILTKEAQDTMKREFPSLLESASAVISRKQRHFGAADLPEELIQAARRRAKPVLTLEMRDPEKAIPLHLLEAVARQVIDPNIEAALAVIIQSNDKAPDVKIYKCSREGLPGLAEAVAKTLLQIKTDRDAEMENPLPDEEGKTQ